VGLDRAIARSERRFYSRHAGADFRHTSSSGTFATISVGSALYGPAACRWRGLVLVLVAGGCCLRRIVPTIAMPNRGSSVRDFFVDCSFPHDYEVRYVAPALARFPAAERTDELLIEIVTSDGPRYAAFAAGSGKLFGAFSCPRPWELCVVAGGTAYIINAREPRSYAATIYENITSVLGVPSHELLLLATDSNIAAYRHASLWDSGTLCVDELKIDGMRGQEIIVSCWDPRSNRRRTIAVDPATGRQSRPSGCSDED